MNTLPEAGRGLAGYWPLNEGSGGSAIDWSGNGGNGTWYGVGVGTNGTYYSAGKTSQWAGAFDGTSTYINAGASAALKPTQITIVGWVNLSASQTATCSPVSRGNINYGSGYFFTLSPSSVRFYASYGGGGNQYDIISANGTYTGWNFYAAVASASDVQLYVNGTMLTHKGSRSGLLGYASGDTATVIGGALSSAPTLSNGTWQPCLGSINDVRVYGRALSANEIQEIYNAEK